MYQVITGNTETRKANEHENQTKINSPSRRPVERLALARTRCERRRKRSKREKKRERPKVEKKKREITGYPFDATKRIKSLPPPPFPPAYEIVFVFKSLDVYTEARRRVKKRS